MGLRSFEPSKVPVHRPCWPFPLNGRGQFTSKIHNPMKTNRIANTIAVAFIFAAFATTSWAETDKTTQVSSSSAQEPAMTPPAAKVQPSITARPSISASSASSDVASGGWSDIKDYNYDSRASFFSGFKRLEAKVDDQIGQLATKRAAMNSSTDTKAWDFAMKEMNDARSYLKSVGDDASKATVETWEQQKEKVGQAWLRVQAAYDQVKSSTTS